MRVGVVHARGAGVTGTGDTRAGWTGRSWPDQGGFEPTRGQ